MGLDIGEKVELFKGEIEKAATLFGTAHGCLRCLISPKEQSYGRCVSQKPPPLSARFRRSGTSFGLADKMTHFHRRRSFLEFLEEKVLLGGCLVEKQLAGWEEGKLRKPL